MFNAETNLVTLLLVETDSVIKKLELVFSKDKKRLFPNSIEDNRSKIKKKHQPYKKQLSQRRRKKWAKFEELHEYSKPVRTRELNIARNKKLELSESQHFMPKVRNEAMNENGTEEKESNSSCKGRQKYSFVTENLRQSNEGSFWK